MFETAYWKPTPEAKNSDKEYEWENELNEVKLQIKPADESFPKGVNWIVKVNDSLIRQTETISDAKCVAHDYMEDIRRPAT